MIRFTKVAWADYQLWIETDTATVRRVNELIKALMRDPDGGIGNPEKLRYALTGCWSRRIDRKNRLVYSVVDGEVTILSVKGHYTSL